MTTNYAYYIFESNKNILYSLFSYSGQVFKPLNNNYSSNHQNHYNSYDIYRPTALIRHKSEFTNNSQIDNYLNNFNQNKKNESYSYSHFNDQRYEMIILKI
jgi:hypothetical protein